MAVQRGKSGLSVWGDGPDARLPLLVRDGSAGMLGWIVIGIAVLAEVIAGIGSNALPLPLLLVLVSLPALVAVGFALAQWLLARRWSADRASWWHLTGAAVAIIFWAFIPKTPGALIDLPDSRAACQAFPPPISACLGPAARAYDNAQLAWWLAFALILAAALLARRSRIASWTAIPVALAGCILSEAFLIHLVQEFHFG